MTTESREAAAHGPNRGSFCEDGDIVNSSVTFHMTRRACINQPAEGAETLAVNTFILDSANIRAFSLLVLNYE